MTVPSFPDLVVLDGWHSLSHMRLHQVRGAVHHERRLHQLMLAEEVKAWDRGITAGDAVVATTSGRAAPAPVPGVPFSEAAPGGTCSEEGPAAEARSVQSSPADSVSSLHQELAGTHIDPGDPHALYR